MSKKSDYELARQAELIEDAWLGLDKTSDEIFNPLENIPDEYIEDPQMYILWLLSQPEYFTLICKYVLKIELYPFQLMILRELWTKKFPILIGCRGLSKTYTLAVYCILRMMLMPGRKIVLTGAVFRQSKLIFEYMERIWNNAPILRDLYGDSKVNGPHHENDAWKFVLGESITYALPIGDGCLTKVCLITTSNGISNIDLGNSVGVVQHDKQIWSSADKKFVYSDQSYNNGVQKTKKITTKRGYSIEGTHNHKLKVFRNNEIVWSRLDEMVVGDKILIDRSERWFPTDSDVTESQAYALGLMIGDGCWTNKYRLGFATKDIELVESLRIGTGLSWKQSSDIVHFDACGMTQADEWLNYWGLERCYAIDKYIPNKILSSSKNTVAALISGLYDTDGHIQVNRAKGGVGICIGFTNTSEKLVDQLQYLLLHFGIISTKSSRTRDNANWNRVYELLIHGKNVRLFYEKINFRLERKRLTLEQALKEKTCDRCNGDEIPDVKKLMIECATGFIDKTIPVELRAKVCLSKIRAKKSITHSYLETFLDVNKNNPHINISILRGLLDTDIYYDTISSIEDGEECTYDIHVPDTHEYCANGFFSHNSTIRGYRAHDIICDEFASANLEVFEHVIKGFAMVSADPINNSKRLARIKKSIELGVKTEEVIEANYKSNQVILSGTAYYEFNHFYKYWKRNKNIILANNNKKKLVELGEDPTVDSNDYGIIRIPYDLLPEGLMDKDIIASAKGNLHVSLYTMEVLACVEGNTQIITDCGAKNIRDLKIGDMVLTHKGRFRPIEKLVYHHHEGEILRIKVFGYNQTISITPEHPVWKNGVFTPVVEIKENFELSNLKELNGKTEIISRDYTYNYKERKGYIYPASGPSKLTNDEVNFIVESDLTTSEKCKILGCSYSNIYSAKKDYNRPKPKNAIPSIIKLDYNFGLVVGYYAAEGSGGDGKISFALDSHVDSKFTCFIEQLKNAILNSIGVTPRIYYKKQDATASIVICSRVFYDIIKWICPGIADTKYIKPEILYSNEDFMKGFIEGYWNGDGHKSDDRTPMMSSSSSESLSTQVRTVLSYFGIASSLIKKEKRVQIIRNKEYNCSEFYQVVLSGNNARKMKSVFYRTQQNMTNPNLHYILNNGDSSLLQIDSVISEKYSGYVYNMEVAEDNSYSLHGMTVHNCFSSDSNGFFKRSLLEKCLGDFPISLQGEKGKQYVLGIDPASETDNFCIVLVEVTKNIRKICYCWTSTKQSYKEELKTGKAKENDFYDYVCRKILNLCNAFNIVGIAIDTQGGGHAIIGRLHNPSIIKSENGEVALWPIINPDKPSEDDIADGRHIIHPINFADSEWTSSANHSLRLEFESRTILFPKFDELTFAEIDLSSLDDLARSDITEEAVMEIEEMKNELSSIVMTQTASGRDRWDTPDQKLPGSKKGRMRKDRYSALLMAAYLGRKLVEEKRAVNYSSDGGVAQKINADKIEPVGFIGGSAIGAKLAKQLTDLYS